MMNRDTIISTIKEVGSDRPYVALIVASLLSTVGFALYILIAIERSDIQVITRYVAFGETHFYKDGWWSLYSFAVFGVVLGVGHSLAMMKLYMNERRDLGIFLGLLVFILIVIAFFYSREVLRLAFI